VGSGQESSFHVMKEVVHRSFLGSTDYNSLLPIMAHDIHVIFQQLKDFLANKGDSNAKDALNAYERKWLSDWARRDWSTRKNELVDCLKQAESLPKPSRKVSLKRKYKYSNLMTRLIVCLSTVAIAWLQPRLPTAKKNREASAPSYDKRSTTKLTTS
jgi:hypothetical protein